MKQKNEIVSWMEEFIGRNLTEILFRHTSLCVEFLTRRFRNPKESRQSIKGLHSSIALDWRIKGFEEAETKKSMIDQVQSCNGDENKRGKKLVLF